jgi:hypothetical protein
MTMSREEIIVRGREEWERKTSDRDWRGWMRIEAALAIGREECERRVGNRKTEARFKGRAFNERFAGGSMITASSRSAAK